MAVPVNKRLYDSVKAAAKKNLRYGRVHTVARG